MSTNGSRRRNERRERLEEVIEETEEDLDGETTGTVDEFTASADPEVFDQTYLAFGDNWRIDEPTPSPAPFPLQVIPRMAYVISYQMIYDEGLDQWVPQKKTLDVGGFGQIVAQENLTVPSGGFVEMETGVTDSSAAIFGWCGFRDPGQFAGSPEVWLTDDQGSADGRINVSAAFDTTLGEWKIVYREVNLGHDVDIVGSAFRIA